MSPKQACEILINENPEGLVKQELLDILVTSLEYCYYYAKHMISKTHD